MVDLRNIHQRERRNPLLRIEADEAVGHCVPSQGSFFGKPLKRIEFPIRKEKITRRISHPSVHVVAKSYRFGHNNPDIRRETPQLIRDKVKAFEPRNRETRRINRCPRISQVNDSIDHAIITIDANRALGKRRSSADGGSEITEIVRSCHEGGIERLIFEVFEVDCARADSVNERRILFTQVGSGFVKEEARC